MPSEGMLLNSWNISGKLCRLFLHKFLFILCKSTFNQRNWYLESVSHFSALIYRSRGHRHSLLRCTLYINAKLYRVGFTDSYVLMPFRCHCCDNHSRCRRWSCCDDDRYHNWRCCSQGEESQVNASSIALVNSTVMSQTMYERMTMVVCFSRCGRARIEGKRGSTEENPASRLMVPLVEGSEDESRQRQN